MENSSLPSSSRRADSTVSPGAMEMDAVPLGGPSYLDLTPAPLQSSPEQALDCLAHINHPTVAVLDFDTTLFLRNSTEEYLDILKPQAFGAIFLLVLDQIKPWRWLPKTIGGVESRDWVRVVLATLFFPWTWFLWRKRLRSWVPTEENKALVQVVAHNPNLRVMLVTRGFEFIVKPMLPYLSLHPEQVVGGRLWRGGGDRQSNKEQRLQSYVGTSDLRRAVWITASIEEAESLKVVQQPLWVQWPQAQNNPALANAYLPFFYLEKVKRPGSKFTQQVIVKNHLVGLLLALSWISPSPILHALGITSLLIAFWCTYEVGYFENDRVAEQYEAKPVLSETYHRYKARMDVREPWIFATFFSLIGILFTYWGNNIEGMWVTPAQIAAFPLDRSILVLSFVLWMSVLVATRLLYRAYNYMDEQTRIWIYPLLQVSKYLGFLVVTTTNIVGMALLISQIFVDWIPYAIYRCDGLRARFQDQILRLFVFLLFCLGVALTLRDVSFLLTWHFAVILAWQLVRIRPQLLALVKHSHWIWQS